MNASGVAIFTAAEFANVLRCSARCIRRLLRQTAAAGTKRPRPQSQLAKAWEVGSLPSGLIQRLAKAAQKAGCNSPLELLQNLPRSGAKSLAHVADSEIERAQKLQRAFSSCLAMPAETSTTERARVAAPHYEREFGKKVSDRYLRKLIDRVLRADRGARNFSALWIYLPENHARRRRVRRSPLSGRFEFGELDQHFIAITNLANPGPRDIAFAWRKVVEFFCQRIEAGADAIALKTALCSYLVHAAPFLAVSPAALKRNFERKLRGAIDAGIESLVDRRLEPGKGASAKQLAVNFESDLKLLAQHARFYSSGRISQAYRELYDGRCHNGDQFSESFRDAFPFDCRKAKSRVPEIVRRAVTPLVKAAGPLRLGPRAAKLSLPSIQRDWSNVAAGDSYTSDDVTLNHYVYDWNDEGEFEFDGRRFNVMRPQFLPMVDERAELPLAFSLIPHRNYTSWHIKTLFARAFMRPEIGLPFKQILVELGLWASRNVDSLSEWTEIDESFARNKIVVKIRHATTPKAKVIEGVIGRLQNLDEFAPAYIGRGEQQVKYERVHKFLLALKRYGQPLKADLNPAEMLMSLDECATMITGVMNRYADEPQNGERLRGISPNEAWRQLSGGRVHRVLPESLRFLLATAESIKTVSSEGIELRIGRLKHKYFGSEKLGSLIGEKVRVRYNPELPEMISVSHIASDPHGANPFSVPLFERLPAHGATSEDFARAREHQNAFAAAGRAIFREIAPKFNRTISHSEIGSEGLRAAGEAHNRIEREHIDLSARRDANRAAIGQLASKQRLAIDPRRVKRPDRVRQRLESAEQRRRRILELESSAGESITEEESK
jgi:Mu transposase, C-terminal